MEALVDLLAPTVKITVPLGEQLMLEESQLEKLTQEQAKGLRQMRRNPRMVFIGCAGSGKTMLAIAHARRLASEGYKVLFTCFNRRLREDLEARYGIEGLDIRHVHIPVGYLEPGAVDVLVVVHEQPDRAFHRVTQHACQAVEPAVVEILRLVDHERVVVHTERGARVDQLAGQFVVPELRSELVPVRGGQVESGGAAELHRQAVAYELSVNCRNTRAIHREVMKKYVGTVEPDVRGPEGRSPDFVRADDQRSAVAEALERLCGKEEIPTQDVVVLSSHGIKNSRIYNDGLPGRYQLTDKWPAPPGKVCFSSIRGFKGLESSVVVLCELEGLEDQTLDQQLYVALSRAKTHCVVVAPGGGSSA